MSNDRKSNSHDCDTLIYELNENVVSEIPEVTHYYTAKQQDRCLKERKENLHSDQCIILADFSENYSFILQDAVQGFHWANNQAILHPFIIHIKDQHLQTLSLCIISDCLDKNIYNFMHFSNGSVAQYKKIKKIINIYHLRFWSLC
jgi:hypothetical protein